MDPTMQPDLVHALGHHGFHFGRVQDRRDGGNEKGGGNAVLIEKLKNPGH